MDAEAAEGISQLMAGATVLPEHRDIAQVSLTLEGRSVLAAKKERQGCLPRPME